MKLPLFVSSVLAMFLAAAPLWAQSETKEEPAAAASLTAIPEKQVSQFFQLLTEGRVDTAYDELLKGSKIADMPKDVAVLKAKTKEAIRVFGDINGYEQIGIKTIGTRLTRLMCLSQGKQFPIRWRFYFYKADDNWRLIDIRIDDRLMDLFEEPAPAAPAPEAPAPAATKKAK
jgi:hypothetical protein